MTWRDVPMPPQIAALPRDERGYPIPYVAQRYPMMLPPPFDADFGYMADEDMSGPSNLELGFMSEPRQRRCMLEVRCQVCERSLRRGTRWMAGGVDDRPLSDFHFREPFVCGSCMSYALRVCPGLISGARKGMLRVVRARSWQHHMEFLVADSPFERKTTRSMGWAPTRGGGQRPILLTPIPAYSCAMYVLSVVTDGDVMTVSDFLDRNVAAGVR